MMEVQEEEQTILDVSEPSEEEDDTLLPKSTESASSEDAKTKIRLRFAIYICIQIFIVLLWIGCFAGTLTSISQNDNKECTPVVDLCYFISAVLLYMIMRYAFFLVVFFSQVIITTRQGQQDRALCTTNTPVSKNTMEMVDEQLWKMFYKKKTATSNVLTEHISNEQTLALLEKSVERLDTIHCLSKAGKHPRHGPARWTSVEVAATALMVIDGVPAISWILIFIMSLRLTFKDTGDGHCYHLLAFCWGMGGILFLHVLLIFSGRMYQFLQIKT